MDTQYQSDPASEIPYSNIHLRLFFAGDSPNSRRAIANLKDICAQYLSNDADIAYEVEYIDVWLHPSQGFDAGVLVTPTLQRLQPKPEVSIIGSLSDTEAVLLALGIVDKAAK